VPKQKPISASLILCEKILLETNVPSAIRIVDTFYVADIPEIPPQHRTIQISALGVMKLAPSDGEEHEMIFQVLRPDGGIQNIGELYRDSAQKTDPDSNIPRGFMVPFQFFVIPNQLGTYYLVWLFDGSEVARTPFTLKHAAATPTPTG
jgi:hypothetical protein